MTKDEELASLRAKLEASNRMPGGYADRVKAIEKRIKELEEAK